MIYIVEDDAAIRELEQEKKSGSAGQDRPRSE